MRLRDSMVNGRIMMMKNTKVISWSVCFGFFALMLGLRAYGGSVPAATNFEGYLTDPNGAPVTDGNYQIRLQVRGGTCVIWEELHSSVPVLDGSFSVRMGRGTRQTGDSGLTSWNLVFSQNQIPAGGANCSSGHLFTDPFERSVRVFVNGTQLNPDYVITSVPTATHANTALQAEGLKLFNSSRTGFVELRGPISGGDSTIYRMPAASGTSGQVLQTDGSGNLSWSSASSFAGSIDVPGQIKIAEGTEVCASPADAGRIRYNVANELQYCNGTAWQTLGVSGAGVMNLNGQTGATQTFAVGATGTSPAFTSSASVHTLNIPLASGIGVTSGTISKTEFDNFNSKQPGSARLTEISVIDPAATSGYTLSSDGTNLLMRAPASARSDLGLGTMATEMAVNYVLRDGSAPLTGNLSAGGFRITNMNAELLAGSPAVPSLRFSGASIDTGLFSSGTDMINFSTAGIERVRIRENGYVGIGDVTTNWPQSHLHINKNSGLSSLLISSGGNNSELLFTGGSGSFYNGLGFKFDGTKFILSPVANGSISGAPFLALDAPSRNLGIDVVSPVSKLHVGGDTTVDGFITAQSITVQSANIGQVIKLTRSPSALPCGAGDDGKVALTNSYKLCVCKEAQVAWFLVSDGASACTPW